MTILFYNTIHKGFRVSTSNSLGSESRMASSTQKPLTSCSTMSIFDGSMTSTFNTFHRYTQQVNVLLVLV